MSTSRSTSEQGVALFYALLVTLVVGGIVAVIFARTITEQRQSAFELDFEDTVHVAEAGAEVYMGRLAEDNSVTSEVDGKEVEGPEAVGQDPATWAIEEATRKSDGLTYDHDKVTLAGGETVALRPSGEDNEFIYGVGFVPTREAYEAHIATGAGEAYARVVRVQVAFAPNTFQPDHAMLTGGNLDLSGGYEIYGSSGSVHTNGAIAIDGSSGTADSGISYSGSCNKGCDQASGPVAEEPIQELDIEDFWSSPEAIEITGAGDWYDYCAGTWYKRSLNDDYPCHGTNGPVGSTDPNIEPWTGLNYNNPLVDSDAVYYFHDEDRDSDAGNDNIEVKQPSGELTFITAGTVDIGPTADADPPTARYPGWFIVAEDDVTVGGNASSGSFETDDSSIVWSNKTITLSGTIETKEVAFVAVDDASIGSSYKGGGGGSITYNGDAFGTIPGEKVPIVVQWDEISEP